MQFLNKLLGRKAKPTDTRANTEKKLANAKTDQKIHDEVKDQISRKPLYTIKSAYYAIKNIKSKVQVWNDITPEGLDRISYQIYYTLNHSKDLKSIGTIFLVTADADTIENDQFSKDLNKSQESHQNSAKKALLNNINTILNAIKNRVSEQIMYQLSDRVLMTQQSASDLNLKSDDVDNINMMTESLTNYDTLSEALKHLKCQAVKKGDNAIISVHIHQKHHNTAYDNGIVGVIYADAIQIKNKPLVPSKYHNDYLHNLDLLNELEK